MLQRTRSEIICTSHYNTYCHSCLKWRGVCGGKFSFLLHRALQCACLLKQLELRLICIYSRLKGDILNSSMVWIRNGRGCNLVNSILFSTDWTSPRNPPCLQSRISQSTIGRFAKAVNQVSAPILFLFTPTNMLLTKEAVQQSVRQCVKLIIKSHRERIT